jgi:hypothetical protein
LPIDLWAIIQVNLQLNDKLEIFYFTSGDKHFAFFQKGSKSGFMLFVQPQVFPYKIHLQFFCAAPSGIIYLQLVAGEAWRYKQSIWGLKWKILLKSSLACPTHKKNKAKAVF